MHTTTTSNKALRLLRRALLYVAERELPEVTACETICRAIEAVEAEQRRLRATETVGVYRQHQPQWTSPCQLGEPCEICKAHAARRKQKTRCPLAKAAAPAFMVPVTTALTLVKDGLATFSENNSSIVLTFSRLAHLRDRSLKIDESFLNAYAAGQKWARNLFDAAWDGKALAETTTWTSAQMAESREKIVSFG